MGSKLIEYGFESNKWLAMAGVANANPVLVKLAVNEVIRWLLDGTDNFSAYEVIDRLVQVSLAGKYTPSDTAGFIAEDALRLANEMESGLSEEDEKLIEDFRDELDGLNLDDVD